MPSNHLILCHPLLLLPSIFPSIRVYFHYYDLLIICVFIFSCAGSLHQCVWTLPGPGTKLPSAALAGGFLITEALLVLLILFFFFSVIEAFTLDCCVSNKFTCRIFLFKTSIHLRNTFWAIETLPDSLEKPYGTWKYIDLQFP